MNNQELKKWEKEFNRELVELQRPDATFLASAVTWGSLYCMVDVVDASPAHLLKVQLADEHSEWILGITTRLYDVTDVLHPRPSSRSMKPKSLIRQAAKIGVNVYDDYDGIVILDWFC